MKRRYISSERGQLVMTSWALMTLILCNETESDAVKKGVHFLIEKQQEDGSWPREHPAGVSFRTCGLDYVSYFSVFPLWALSLYEESRVRENFEHFQRSM
jgi:squalene cyclase